MPGQHLPEGSVLKSWKLPEFPAYKRGRWWYVVAIAAAVILLIYAFLSTNYLFAIIILMFGVIIALTGMREPEMVEAKITETGIKLHEHFYPYRDIKKFSIIYQPPIVKTLYLEMGGGLQSRVTVQLEDENPLEIRDLLIQHVNEDLERTNEPLIEFLGRIFKI